MVATSNQQQQQAWTEGVSTMVDAARHNMTAARLAAAGAVAIGAAATAYLWDAERRNRGTPNGATG